MASLVIQGAKKLKGELKVQGSKNATTPIIAATLLGKGNFILENIPQIEDVKTMLKILKLLGAKVEEDFVQHRLQINTTNVVSAKAEFVEIKRLRSSILLLGPLLARFGYTKLLTPGGCMIGNRPLGAHFKVLEAFKMKVKTDGEKLAVKNSSPSLQGTKIILPEFSVTATENALMLAVLAEGKTVIKLAAAEPHIVDLGNFLIKAGAKIKGLGTHTIEVEGVREIKPVRYKIIPDYIEAGTFLVLGALLGGPLVIKQIPLNHLDIILEKLKEIGVCFKILNKKKDSETILATLAISAVKRLNSFKIQTMPYPGFPTDLQAPFSILATQTKGINLIHDPMYEGRFNYLQELNKMGAKTILADPHRLIIYGPTPLRGAHIKSFDLRAGATLILAALLAQGETVIDQAEEVDRGYEKIAQRLRQIGGEIKRI